MKPDEPWFLNQHGTWYKKMRQALKTACKNAKVPHCTHHFTETCSRDDSANEGKDIGTISKLLRHANPTITQNMYLYRRDKPIHQAVLDVEVCAQELQKVQNRKVAFEPT